MSETYILEVDVKESSSAVANTYALELGEKLRNASRDVSVEQSKPDPNTQDLGATLVLVLGAPAAVAAVKAIDNWLQTRTNAKLTVKTKNGEVVAEGLTSADAIRLAELIDPKPR